jgi:hypothetical protein
MLYLENSLSAFVPESVLWWWSEKMHPEHCFCCIKLIATRVCVGWHHHNVSINCKILKNDGWYFLQNWSNFRLDKQLVRCEIGCCLARSTYCNPPVSKLKTRSKPPSLFHQRRTHGHGNRGVCARRPRITSWWSAWTLVAFPQVVHDSLTIEGCMHGLMTMWCWSYLAQNKQDIFP